MCALLLNQTDYLPCKRARPGRHRFNGCPRPGQTLVTALNHVVFWRARDCVLRRQVREFNGRRGSAQVDCHPLIHVAGRLPPRAGNAAAVYLVDYAVAFLISLRKRRFRSRHPRCCNRCPARRQAQLNFFEASRASTVACLNQKPPVAIPATSRGRTHLQPLPQQSLPELAHTPYTVVPIL